MPASVRCSILSRLTGQAAGADPLGDLQISGPGVMEQFGKLHTHVRVLFEKELFEHDAVDAYHLLQMGS